MKVKVILFEDNYYLSLDSGEIRQLTEKNIRNFLKNYDSYCNSEEFNTLLLTKADISNGTVVACTEENKGLHIFSTTLLNNIISTSISSYITREEYAEKHGRKRAVVLRLCGQGRIPGAIQKGSIWLIPEDAPYPADARVGTKIRVIEQ